MKKFYSFKTLILTLSLAFIGLSASAQTTVTYPQQVGNYYSNWTTGTAGAFNQGANQVGMYANGGGTKQVVSWRKFRTDASGSSTGDRALQVGDQFVVTLSATRAFGKIGFALLASPGNGSWANRESNYAISFNLDGPAYAGAGVWGNWYARFNGGATSAGSSNVAGQQTTYKNFTFTLTLTAPDRMNASWTDGTTTSTLNDIQLNTSNPITDYSIFLDDNWDGGANRDIFWGLGAVGNQHTVTNAGSLNHGQSNSSYTIGGVMFNGLNANSSSSNTLNNTFVKNGSGNVTLTAANTYAGQTQLNNGELWIGSGGSISTSSGIFVGNGGQPGNVTKLWLSNSTGGTTFSNNFTINDGNLTTREIGGLNTSGNHIFSGAITNNATTGGLRINALNAGGTATLSGVVSGGGAVSTTGSGIVVFSGASQNTYTNTFTAGATTTVFNKSADTRAIGTGNVTINTGVTLRTDANNQLGTGTPSLITINGNGVFNLNSTNQKVALASASTTASVTLGSGTLNIDNTGTDTYAGVISGTGGVTKTNAGIEIFTNTANSYTGTTTITTGEIRLQPSANATYSSQIVMNGGTLGTTGITSTRTWTSSSTLNLTANSTIALQSGTAHTLTFANSSIISWSPLSILTITGWSGIYNGTSNGTTGKIFIGSSAASLTGQQISQIVFNNGTNNFSAVMLSTGELVPSSNIIIPWTNAGGATAWYTTTNWTPSTTSSAWTISNIAQFNNAGTANIAGINMTTGSLSIGAIDATNARVTNSLTVGTTTGIGTLTLNGAVVRGISNTILSNNSTRLLALTDANMGVVLGNATNNLVNISGTGGITIGSIISGVNRNLTKEGIGAGVLTLSAANTYGGTTTINNGNITCAAAAALPATTDVTLANTASASLTLNTFNQTINSLAGGGTIGGNISLSSALVLTVSGTLNTTYSGVLSGIGALVKSGTGILTLANAANAHTGTTTINTTSEIRLNPASNATYTSQIKLNGGKLSTTGIAASRTWTSSSTLSLDANSSIDLDAAVHTLTFANSSAVTWSGTTLTINGWTGTGGASGTGGKIFFGNTTGTLTAGQLSKITFTGYPGTPILLSTGELVPAAPLVPSIAISGVNPGASSVTIGTNDVILHQYNLAVTVAGTNLTGLNVTTAGTYISADITNLKVRYSTDAILDVGDATLSTFTTPGAAGTKTFPSFSSQAISSGTTGYIFITADVAVGATVGNTINIASNAFSNFTFSSGTKTGTDPVAAAGIKTFSSLVPSIAISNSAPASSNQNAGTNNVVLQRLDFAVTVTGTTFNGLTVTTAGTYASADIANLKVRYSTDNVLDGGDATLSTFTTPGVAGSKVFPSFTSQALASGATYYIFITADIASGATGGNTISLGSTAFSNISFTSGTKTGTNPVAASNTVTIVNPAIAISNSSPAASSHLPSSTNIVLNRFDFAVTSSNTTLTGITVTTAGTYVSADVVNLKVRYSTDATLDGGDATLSTFTTPGVAGSKVFPSFTSQVITSGTTGYIFITADLSSTATPNNTISLGTTAFSNLTFTLGNKTGTDPVAAGNTRTFIKAEPTNYPTAFTCGTTTTTTIPLTWTDASAGVLPDGYLIQWSNTSYGSITAPSDGTPVADLANATLGARNVAQGVGAYTIPSLTSGTTYFMRIWSYTNSGTNINYKLVSEPQTSCATTTAPVTIWSNPVTGTNPGLSNPYTTGDVVVSNLTVSGISLTGAVGTAANNRYNANTWSTGAIDLAKYFQFTLTPDVGYEIDFNSFVYTGQVSSGTPTLEMRSSLDGYTASIGSPSVAGTTVSLTAGAYQNITSAITFRVYVYNIAGAGTTYSINDFSFTGNVNSIGTITTGTIGGGTTAYCVGATGVSVPFTYTPAGNFPNGVANFTAQLSDASGSFASPVNLQSVSSNASGSQSISATIPAGTATGTGYRIRVVSASPTVNGQSNGTNLTINNSSTSIAPAGAQTLVTSANGATLTVTEGHTATSRQWKYGTAPGGPYGTNLGTATTQIPNFAVANTYYIVCESTYPAPCSNTVTSNEVQINVTTPSPEINVVGNSVNIVDNDLTPSLTDHTDFSNVAWGATFTRTYTIQNTGTGTLNITLPIVIGGAQAGDYSVTTPPSATIAPGGSSNFIVTFTPAAIGLRSASITINNDDSDEAIYNFNIQGTGTPSNLSTIEFNTSTTPQNIDYSLAANQVNDLVSTSLAVMEFRIRDGGATNTDADNLGTTLNAITLNITNWANLKRLALYNGATEIAEASVTGPTLTFSGLTGSEVTAPDNSNRIITLRVSFQTTVTDNQQFSFSFANANVTALSTNSQFTTFSTVNSETTADRNRIEVTADRLRFGTQPANGSVNVNLAPFTVRFQDINNNLDFDNNRTVTLATSGVNMSPATPSVTITAPHTGIATFSAVSFTTGPQTAINLTATTTALATDNDDISNNFNITSFTFLAGDYRPNYAGSDFSFNGGWDSFNGTTWTLGVTAPQNLPTGTGNRPGRIIIDKASITGAGSSAETYNDIIIIDGGELTFDDDDNPPVAAELLFASKRIEVLSGGILHIEGDIDLPSSANLIVRSGGQLIINQASMVNDHPMWDGTELFEGGSTVTINDWNWTAAPTAASLINISTAITNNANGYKFGNLIVDVTTTANWNIIGGSIGIINLVENNFDITNASAFWITGATNQSSTNGYIVNGNLTIYDGNFSFGTNYSVNSFNHQFTIRGNFENVSNDAFKLHHNASGTPVNLNGSVTFLGDVIIGSTVTSFTNDGGSGSPARIGMIMTGGTLADPNILDVAPIAVAVPITIGNGSTSTVVKMRTQDLVTNSVASYTAPFTVTTNALLDFGFNTLGTTALNIRKTTTSPAGTNTFITNSASTLVITSPDGIQQASGTTGNVQYTTGNKTFNQLATFWYKGVANQVTGDAITTASNGKVLIVELNALSTTLTLTNGTGITSATGVDALGGKLEIRQGTLVSPALAPITSDGRLIMTGGAYKIAELNTCPQLTGAYTLSGGTVNLDGAGNQILRGGRDYVNLAFSTSGTKTLSSALTANSLNDLVTIQDAAILDVASNDFSGTSALNMTGTSRFRMSLLNTTLPQLTGTYTLTGGTVELYGTGAAQTHSLRGSVTYNNVDINATAASVAATQANVVAGAGFALRGAMIVNSPACFQLAGGFTITDAGTSSFTLASGSTLKYGGTIDASGATGNIQVDTRTFSTTASYGFIGSTTPQAVGTGLPASMVNLYMDKGAATNVVTLAANTTITNQLVLGTGILDAVSNTVSVSNTATTAVTGASSNSFVSGKLNRSLPSSLLTGTTYDFALGKQSPITYLPVSLVNPTTGIGAVSVTMEAFNTNSSGTPDPNSIGSLSTAEYWSLAATGNFNGSQFTLSRPTAVSPLSSIARSTTTATGTYVFIGGTPSGSQIANSNFSAGNTQFLAFANPIAPPTITLVQGTSPTFAGQANYTGYVGQTLTITGTNFTSTANMTVSIGGLAATTFTVVNSTTITAVVAQAASGATIVVTNTVTSGNASAAFTFLGWITNASSDWGTGSTWLGGSVPPASVAVTIANSITANGTVANNPNTLTIRSGSSLTFGTAGTLTVNTSLTNGGSIIMTAGGTLTMANASTFANGSATFTGGTGTVVFAGTATVTTTGGIPFNNVTINAAINLGASTSISGTLRVNQGASIITNALTYGAGSTLSYNGSSSQTPNALEFPASSGPTNFTANNSVNVSLPFSRTVSGNVRILSGDLRNSSGTGVTLTMSGAAATLEVTGALQGTDIGAGNDINLIISGTTTVSGSNLTTCKVLNTTVNTGATLALARSNFEVRYGAFNINGTGTLRIDANGNVASIDGNSRVPIYASTANLVYNSGGTYGRFVEWSTLSGPAGYPGNVTIQNGTTLNIGTPTTDLGIVSNLTLGVTGSAGSLNMQSTAQGITVGGNVNIGSDVATSTLTLSTNASSPALRLAGNWNRNSFGSFVGTGANGRGVFFNGTGAQSLTANGGETFQFLIIQKTIGTNLTLNNAVTVESDLNLTSGNILLGTNNLTLNATATISNSSASSFVITNGTGYLQKVFTANGTYTWPVGDNTGTVEYSPATLNVTSSGGTLGMRVVNAPHPNNGSSVHYINRYWNTSMSATSYSWDGSFNYTNADVVGTQTNMLLNIYDPNAPNIGWTEYPSSSAAANVLTVTTGPSTASLNNTDITGRKDVPLYYRSIASGDWSDVTKWESSTDPAFISPAPTTPVATAPNHINSAGIQIRNSHTITVSTAVAANDLDVQTAGVLTVGAGGNFTLVNGFAATDFTVNGTFNVNNTTTLASGSSTILNSAWNTNTTALSSLGNLVANSFAVYTHNVNGGTIPTATWNAATTVIISGITNTAPTGLSQNFYDVEWNCPAQSTAVQLSSNPITTIQNNLTITNTGSPVNDLRLYSGASGGTTNIGGNLTINGGRLGLSNGGVSNAATVVVNVSGNVNINGGLLTFTGTTTQTANFNTLNITGNLTLNGGNVNFNSTGFVTSGNQTLNLGGNLDVQSGQILRSVATNSCTFRFNKVLGTQTYSASIPATSVSTNLINWEVGDGTTEPELILSNSIIIKNGSTFRVKNKATLNCGAFSYVGDDSGGTTFTLESEATIKTANADGIISNTGINLGSVQSGLSRNFNSNANYIYNGTLNQVTGTGLPTAHTGTLEIASSATVTLTTTNSTGSDLKLTSGAFAIGNGQIYTISSGGTVTSNGGDFATGINGGTLNFPGTGTFTGSCSPHNVHIAGGVNFGAGTVTIQNGGRLRILAGGFVNTNAPAYAIGSTLEYNTGGNYDRGLEWSTASGKGFPYHVAINTSTLNPARTGANFAATTFNTGGNLSITSGGNIYMDFGGNNMTVPLIINGNLTLVGQLSGSASVGGDIRLRGNWINDGSATNNYFPNSRAVFFDGSSAQTIGGTNTVANPFTFVFIDNTAGVSLLASQTINNQLTHTNGLLSLGNFDLTMAPGSLISGAGVGKYTNTNGNGRLIQEVVNGGGDKVYPIGTATSYAPVTLNQGNTTDNIGIRVKTAPAFSPAVNDFNQMVNFSYNINEAVGGGNNLITKFQWNTSDEAAGFIRSSTVYHGDWDGSLWQIRAASATAGANPFTSTAAGFIGNLSAKEFVVGNINGIRGCFATVQAGDWDDPLTWGGTLPPTNSTVCLSHALSVTTANPNNLTALTFNSGSSLSLSPSRIINIVAGGTVSNNSGSVINLSNGTVAFLGNASIGGTQSITFNNLDVNGAATINISPTINGTLSILNSGFINTNSVIYGPSSTLNYIPFTSYNVSTEWTGNSTTPGLGVPANVTLANGVTLNMPNTARGCAGTLQIVNGTLVLNNTPGSDLYIAGDWVRLASGNFTPNNRAVFFNGTGAQTISNSSLTESFPYLYINKPSGTLTLTTDVNITSNSGTGFGLSTGGNLNLNNFFLNFASSGGNINANGGLASITGSGTIVISNGTKNITSSGGGTFSFGPNVTIALSSGLDFGSSLSTVNGTLQIANGGFVSINPPTYSNTSTLRYFSGSVYGRGAEWSTTSGPGYPNNVTIDFNGTPTTLDLSNGGSAIRQIAGNLTINNGGTLTMNTTPMTNYLRVLGNVTIGSGASGSLILSSLDGGDLQVGGNLTRNAGATFTQNTREVTMNGTAIQDINNVTSFNYLKIENIGSSVRLNANTDITNRLWLSSGLLNLNGNNVNMANGSKIRRSQATATMSAAPTIATSEVVDMEYNGTLTSGNEFINDQDKIRDLVITAGTLTLNGNRTINRDLVLSGGDFNLSTFTFTDRGRTTAPAFAGSISVSGGGTRLITGAIGSRFDITGLGANQPNDYTKTVSTSGGTLLNFDSNVLLRVGDGAIDFGAGNPTTINGTLQILLGGSVGQILNPCNYGTNSTLRISNTVDYVVGVNDKTWAAGAINSGNAGIPFNVEILDAGTDLRLEDTRSLRGNLTITNGSFSLNYVGVGTFSLGGNWSRTGATSLFNDPTSKKIIFDRQAAGDQSITTGSGVAFETFYDLEISPALGNVIATSGTAINVTNNLNFVTGKFILNGTNLITVGSASASGSITGVTPSKYLVTYSGGNSSTLKRFTNSNSVYNFPVGDATNYTPIDLTLYNGSATGSFITGSVTATSHPQIGTSLNYLNRYWSMEQTGLLAGFAYGVDFSYVQTDVAGSEATLFPYKWTPGSGQGTGWIGAGGSSAASQMGSGSVDIALNTMHWEGIYSFSDITGNGGGTPLPISLINFDAKKNGNTTALSWSTLSETNNDFFTVERTTDGVNYIELDKVDGAGNHNGILNYSTEDTNPVNGKNYYRLKQTDFDGNFEYSKLVLVEFEGIKSQKSISLYPNPSNGNNVNVSISGVHNKSLIILRLSNSTGAEVYNSNLTAASDFANVQLQTSELANGMYYLQIIIDGEIINQKVVVSNR
jgi:hypothetical protein